MPDQTTEILVVDDDVAFASPLLDHLESCGINATLATTFAEAKSVLSQRNPRLVFIDLMLPDGNGLELIKALSGERKPRVVLMTGHPSMESAIGALREHVDEYLIKPLCLDDIMNCLKRVEEVEDAGELENTRERPAARRGSVPQRTERSFGPLLGAAPAMQALYDDIEKVAATDAAVLIQGESGSGKELAASVLHELSGRRGRLVALNCGAIPEHLIGSELFGHEKGSFTGATNRRRGSFERAHAGTLFLDEITEMPAELQINFLRVLETQKIIRVGGQEEIDVDVRLLAATNRDPLEAVADGALREDLYFRLNVFPMTVPPLRERKEDVPLLAEAFLAAMNDDNDASKTLSDDALNRLVAHAWPGNVRELRHALKRAFILADDEITGEHLSLIEDVPAAWRQDRNRLAAGMSIGDAERRLIEITLAHYDGDKKKTAEALGVSLKTLYNRLNQYASEERADASK